MFLKDNYYFIAQKLIINFIFENIFGKITDEFIKKFNSLTETILKLNKNKELIKGCFMVKFNDFEKRLNAYQSISFKPKIKSKNNIYIYNTNDEMLNKNNNNIFNSNNINDNNTINNNFNINDKLKLKVNIA